MSKVILYIAQSLDGFIAGPNDDLSFLELVSKEGEDYGYNNFIDQIGTIVLGRKTFDWVVNQVGTFGHEDKKVYVLTTQQRANHNNVEYYSGDVSSLVQRIRMESDKDIFLDGGAETVATFLKQGLVDECIISTIPIMIGEGTRLFKDGIPRQEWKVLDVKTYETGLIQMHLVRE